MNIPINLNKATSLKEALDITQNQDLDTEELDASQHHINIINEEAPEMLHNILPEIRYALKLYTEHMEMLTESYELIDKMNKINADDNHKYADIQPVVEKIDRKSVV